MTGSSTAASREADRRAAPTHLGTGRGQATVPRDRRTLGHTNTLLERGVDLERLRGDRLRKVQTEMRVRDVGALLLTDPINIRYVTGVSVMPLWSATNLAHYVLVPAEGSPVVFEFAQAKFRAEEFFSDVRNAHYWQARFAEGMAAERSGEWGAEIKDALTGWGVGDARLGVDSLDYHGFSALQGLRVRLTDADDPVEAARVIKTPDEIELLKQSAAVCEAALYDLAEAIRPGVSEHELLGVFYHKMLSLGGEHCFSHSCFVSMTMSKKCSTRIVGSASVLPTKVDRSRLGSRGGRQNRKRCIRIYHSSSTYLYRPKHADHRICRVRATGGPDSLRSAHRRTTLRGRDNKGIRHRKVEENTEEVAEFCIALTRHWEEIIERCTPQKF